MMFARLGFVRYVFEWRGGCVCLKIYICLFSQILPPADFDAGVSYANLSFIVDAPIYQHIEKCAPNVYYISNIAQANVTLEEYRKKAEQRSTVAKQLTEAKYWVGLGRQQPVLYGSDVSLSLLNSPNYPQWNFSDLPFEPLKRIALEEAISGVNSPYVYVGSARTSFAWHVEDYQMGALNYHHIGAPKQWYIVNTAQKVAMQEVMAQFASDDMCPGLLNHKESCPFQSLETRDSLELKYRESRETKTIVLYIKMFFSLIFSNKILL